MAIVYLVDDHQALSEALAEKIERDSQAGPVGPIVVKVMCSLAELEIGLNDALPDLVLLDLGMPQTQGLATILALEEIQSRLPQRVNVALFSAVDFDSPEGVELAQEAISRGMTGVIPKDGGGIDKMLVGLSRMLERQLWVPDTLMRRLLTHQRAKNPLDNLTPRQKEVAAALADGLTNKEIARKYNLKPTYVPTVITQVFERLGVRNRTEVANKWFAHSRH